MEHKNEGNLAFTVLVSAGAAALAAVAGITAFNALTDRRGGGGGGGGYGRDGLSASKFGHKSLERHVSFCEEDSPGVGLMRQSSIMQEAVVRALHVPLDDVPEEPTGAGHQDKKQEAMRAKEEIIGAITQSSLKRRLSGFSMEDAFHFAQEEQERVMQMTPREVLGELQKGNTRFWMGVASRPEMSAFERRALIMSQYPQVAVLGCADSRVPVEIVFDQGLGDIFVVRVAGNCIARGSAASLEYAVCHLNVKVLLVMGHEGCGAVKAAQLPMETLAKEPEDLRNFLMAIKEGLDVERLQSAQDPRAHDREAVVTNVNHTLLKLQEDESIMRRVKTGDLMLVGAFYEISSGIVDFVKEIEA